MPPESEHRTGGKDARKGFFHMSAGDVAYLLVILAFAVVALLPWARHVHWAGVALLGWLMAALMVVAPLVALIRIVTERRDRDRGGPS